MKAEETVVVIPHEDPADTVMAIFILLYVSLMGTYGILRIAEVFIPTLPF